MSPEDRPVAFVGPATRRTIVATGAKLAYAAPLVAASFKVSAMNVAAATSPPHFVCTRPDGRCSCGPGCEAQDPCFCTTAIGSGAFVCAFDLSCGGGFCDPVTGAGCVAGDVCVIDGFFEGRAHCHSLCGVPCPQPPDGSTRGAPAHS
jgi:hypothetical protein